MRGSRLCPDPASGQQLVEKTLFLSKNIPKTLIPNALSFDNLAILETVEFTRVSRCHQSSPFVLISMFEFCLSRRIGWLPPTEVNRDWAEDPGPESGVTSDAQCECHPGVWSPPSLWCLDTVKCKHVTWGSFLFVAHHRTKYLWGSGFLWVCRKVAGLTFAETANKNLKKRIHEDLFRGLEAS